MAAAPRSSLKPSSGRASGARVALQPINTGKTATAAAAGSSNMADGGAPLGGGVGAFGALSADSSSAAAASATAATATSSSAAAAAAASSGSASGAAPIGYPTNIPAGSKLAAYKMVGLLGQGRYAYVWRAKRIADGVSVAIKQIKVFDLKSSEQTSAMNEARILVNMKHGNIIECYDVFVHDNQLFIILQLAACDLNSVIEQKRNSVRTHFTERDIWWYIGHVSAGLGLLHSKRIIHRDIKPANIYLLSSSQNSNQNNSPPPSAIAAATAAAGSATAAAATPNASSAAATYNEVRLGDMGLSRIFSAFSEKAATIVGTPLYMAPELVRGDSYTYKSDLWSFGCLIYELAALVPPFQADHTNLFALAQKIQNGSYAPIPSHYSPALRDLVTALLSKDPSARPDTSTILTLAQTQYKHSAATPQLSIPATVAPTAAAAANGSSVSSVASAFGFAQPLSPSPLSAFHATQYQPIPQSPQSPLMSLASLKIHTPPNSHSGLTAAAGTTSNTGQRLSFGHKTHQPQPSPASQQQKSSSPPFGAVSAAVVAVAAASPSPSPTMFGSLPALVGVHGSHHAAAAAAAAAATSNPGLQRQSFSSSPSSTPQPLASPSHSPPAAPVSATVMSRPSPPSTQQSALTSSLLPSLSASVLNRNNTPPNNTASSSSASPVPLPSPSGGMRWQSYYDDLGVLGRGQYSEVHKAKSKKTGALVAVKVVQVIEMDSVGRKECINEAKILQALPPHPSVLRYIECFSSPDALILVLELADTDLASLLQLQKTHGRGQPLPEINIWFYFIQIADALRVMHRQRIMHRDIKPSNIFLTGRDRVVKVGDLGLGRYLSASTKFTLSAVGTPFYMSPELISGKGGDLKSDIWSLGCLLYELCALVSPFYSDEQELNLYTLGTRIQKAMYTPLSNHFSKTLRDLVGSMIRPNPTERPDIQTVYTIAKQTCASIVAKKQPAAAAATATAAAAGGAAVASTPKSSSSAAAAATAATASSPQLSLNRTLTPTGGAAGFAAAAAGGATAPAPAPARATSIGVKKTGGGAAAAAMDFG